jgi:hypothetical protein
VFARRPDDGLFDIALGACRAALSAILKRSKNKRKGKEVTAFTPSERENVAKLFDGIAATAKPVAPKLALKLFTRNLRRKGTEESEWKTLEPTFDLCKQQARQFANRQSSIAFYTAERSTKNELRVISVIWDRFRVKGPI